MLDRGHCLNVGQLAADDGHLAFITDRLGLVGPPAAEQRGTSANAVAAILEHLPLLRLTTEHVTAGMAEQIWPLLEGLIGERTS